MVLAWYSESELLEKSKSGCFDIKHIASLKEAIIEDFVERAINNVDGDFLHLATALDPQWKDLKVNNKSGREGCWRKLRAKLDLLKGEEDDARDKVDAPKPKGRLLDVNESVDDSDGESEMDELTRF